MGEGGKRGREREVGDPVGELIFILVVVGVTLTVLLWGGTTFLQGYFYTEASTDVFWQAPAAASALTVFFGLWCLLDYNAEGARAGDLPFDTIFRFSADETKFKKPVPHLWAVRKNEKEPVKYKRRTEGPNDYRYYVERDGQPDIKSPWRRVGVVAILIEEDGQKVRYDLAPAAEGTYSRFVGPGGWEITEYDAGPTGQPTIFRTGLLLVNVLLNLLHFGVWFVCLWLLLRFQWGHAFGLALVLWLIMTVAVLPMLLVRAGAAAQESAAPPPAPKASLREGPRGPVGQPDASTCMMSPSCTT